MDDKEKRREDILKSLEYTANMDVIDEEKVELKIVDDKPIVSEEENDIEIFLQPVVDKIEVEEDVNVDKLTTISSMMEGTDSEVILEYATLADSMRKEDEEEVVSEKKEKSKEELKNESPFTPKKAVQTVEPVIKTRKDNTNFTKNDFKFVLYILLIFVVAGFFVLLGSDVLFKEKGSTTRVEPIENKDDSLKLLENPNVKKLYDIFKFDNCPTCLDSLLVEGTYTFDSLPEVVRDIYISKVISVDDFAFKDGYSMDTCIDNTDYKKVIGSVDKKVIDSKIKDIFNKKKDIESLGYSNLRLDLNKDKKKYEIRCGSSITSESSIEYVVKVISAESLNGNIYITEKVTKRDVAANGSYNVTYEFDEVTSSLISIKVAHV